MKATSIPAAEAEFRNTGVVTPAKKYDLRPFTATIPGTEEEIEFVACTPSSGDRSYFYDEITPKKRIVLHFTAGYLKWDIATLTQPGNHVSTPFVLARDGTIYNLFDSRKWSYHLGKGAAGGNMAMSKSGVAIEICNIGWLTRDGDRLVTYQSKPGAPDVYCRADEQEFYCQVPAYRKQEYYATFTHAQYDQLAKLVRFLAAKYDIPLTFIEPERRYEVMDDIANFRGVTSHVNYRPTGKWDIGPAFDWDRLIEAVGGTVRGAG